MRRRVASTHVSGKGQTAITKELAHKSGIAKVNAWARSHKRARGRWEVAGSCRACYIGISARINGNPSSIVETGTT